MDPNHQHLARLAALADQPALTLTEEQEVLTALRVLSQGDVVRLRRQWAAARLRGLVRAVSEASHALPGVLMTAGLCGLVLLVVPSWVVTAVLGPVGVFAALLAVLVVLPLTLALGGDMLHDLRYRARVWWNEWRFQTYRDEALLRQWRAGSALKHRAWAASKEQTAAAETTAERRTFPTQSVR